MGRPRDEELDAAILTAAAELLNAFGVSGLTFEAVAAHANTSRPAIYRRYRSLTELSVAALGAVAGSAGTERTGDHLADLTAELAAFREAIERTRGINVAASALLDDTDEAVKDAYRTHVVQPRRTRLRAILDDAVDQAASDTDHGTAARIHDDDLAVAVTMCTGSWYGYALAGIDPPDDWPARTASLVWRALGLAERAGPD